MPRRGDRAGALAAYHAWRTQMATEYDSTPSPETQSLIESVRERHQAGPVAAESVPTNGSGRSSASERETPTPTPAPAPSRAPGFSFTLAAAVGIALLAAGVLWERSSMRRPPAQFIGRLAILPLHPASPDTGQRTLANGMTQELIGAVTRAGGRVIAYSSVLGYPEGALGVQRAARTLKVDAVATGTLTRTDSGLTIALEVVDPATHETRFSFRETVRSDEISLLASRAARRLVAAIHTGPPSRGRDGLTPARPVNPLAYGAYLRGMDMLWKGDDRAFSEFRRSVAIDTTFAAGYAELGEAALLVGDYLSPADSGYGAVFALADTAIRRALGLDPRCGAAHRAMGWLLAQRDFDWSGAEREFRTAVELEPSSRTFKAYGLLLNRLGRDRDAAILFRQGALDNPSCCAAQKAVAWSLAAAGDTSEALREVARQLAADSTAVDVVSMLFEIEASRGHLLEALAAISWWGRLAGIAPEANLYRAALLGRLGHHQESRAIVPRVSRDWLQGYPYLAVAAGDSVAGFAMMDDLASRRRPFEFLNATLLAPELLHNARFRAVLARYGVDPGGDNGLNDGWVARQFDRPSATASRGGPRPLSGRAQ